jgi:hypothetical protein
VSIKVLEPPVSLRALFDAWRFARQGKVPSHNQLEFDSEWSARLLQLQRDISAGTWKPRPCVCFIATRPKSREIHALWIQPHYRATDPAPDLCCERENCAQCRGHDMGPHWRPSIHMPRWASRILLEVTDVRVQRLQDISETDAIAEGIVAQEFASPDKFAFVLSRAQELFVDLWDSINGPRGFGWSANPWVWAITFRRIETPI